MDQGNIYHGILRKNPSEKELFTFVNPSNRLLTFDGVIMLFLVLTTLDPSVVVGVKVMRKKLENMKLCNYKNNVDDMCTAIEELMEKIEGAGKKCESIRRYVLTALTSGPNTKFNSYVDCIEDDIEAGTGSTAKCPGRILSRRRAPNSKTWNRRDLGARPILPKPST